MLQTKICSDCKIEKSLSEFTVDKRSKTGTTCRCKLCTELKSKQWYQANKNRILTERREKYQPKGKPEFPHHFEEAKEIGAVLLERSAKHGYGVYRLQCGHEGVFRYSHVRDKNITCQVCRDEEVAFRAMYVGLILNFGKEVELGRNYRNYTFDCGHSRDLRTEHVANGNFKCKICQELKNKEEAEKHDLVLLGKSSNSDPNYRSYLLSCGCVRDIKVGAASLGIWACRACNAGYVKRPSNIYLIRFKTETFSWLKLGFSHSVESRIREYKLTTPFLSEILFLREINSGQDAFLLEKRVHKNLKSHRLPKDMMRKFHSKSGYTECYEDGFEDIIIQEIKEVLQQYGKETKNQ
jgi:hypothetical protein